LRPFDDGAGDKDSYQGLSNGILETGWEILKRHFSDEERSEPGEKPSVLTSSPSLTELKDTSNSILDPNLPYLSKRQIFWKV
jgi:hypothetical protein